MREPQKKSGKKKKESKSVPVAKLFKKPRVKRIKRARATHKCHVCLRMVRVNKDGFISWHRNPQKTEGKWCLASTARATKLFRP